MSLFLTMPIFPKCTNIGAVFLPTVNADKVSVNDIVKDLENEPSHQPLRWSERLNPPVIQPPEPELRCNRCLKHQANSLNTKDPNIEVNLAMVSIVNKIIDPPSIEAVRNQKDWLEWEISIKAELKIHKKLGMGVLVTPPPNVNIVGSWIILCYKLNKDSSISTCKSRLVAQGFTQQEGIDFTDTFSLMAKLTTVGSLPQQQSETTRN